MVIPTSPIPIYHLTHIDNLPSILDTKHLLSHNVKQKAEINHVDISYGTIQDKRVLIDVPCGAGGNLHDYVPFYFAPRSPMLYTINRGNVERFKDGQASLMHLVTYIETIVQSGVQWVFTDGHGIMSFTEFFDDLEGLSEVDWAVMQSEYWNDTQDHPDRKRRRQAEFLLYDSCPWDLISEIGVMNASTKSWVAGLLANNQVSTLVSEHSEWYY